MFFFPPSHLTLFSTDIELTSRSKRPHQARASPQRGSRALSKATFKFSSPSPARCCTHRPETRVFQPCCKQGVCNTVETRVFHRRCNRGVADTLKHPCFSPSFKTPLLQRCEIGGDFTDALKENNSMCILNTRGENKNPKRIKMHQADWREKQRLSFFFDSATQQSTQ